MRMFARRSIFTGGVALALMFLGANVKAQDAQVQDQAQLRSEVANFDQFLDAHPDLDKQLRANPALVNDRDFLQDHPELREFFGAHARIKEQFQADPSGFMRRENRLDARGGTRDQDQGRDANRDRDADRDRNQTADNDRNRQGDNDRVRNNPNPDLTRQELATMDQFMDSHPDIDKQLRTNPSLINQAAFLQDHPQLRDFLIHHPTVQAEFRENPSFFMHREDRFDAREADRDRDRDANTNRDRDADRDRNQADNDRNRDDNDRNRQGDNDRVRNNPNPDLTRQELATMDEFMDSHPDIDKQLRANPSLINQTNFLQDHPQLRDFLIHHPTVQEEFRENPSFFMHREDRLDARERDRDRDRDADRNRDADDRDRNRNQVADNDRDRNDNDVDRDRNRDRDADRDRDRDIDRDRANPRNPNPDLTTGELASMDQFLDDHPKVEKDLEKKPDLINDPKFVKHHKDLERYLIDHPKVRTEVKETPSFFMHREEGFDRAEDRKELQDMDRFLDKHKKIAKDLEKNPSLANNENFLRHHKDLDKFFRENPQVGTDMKRQPSEFMAKEARFERHEAMNHHQPPAAEKTKMEQKEETRPATPH